MTWMTYYISGTEQMDDDLRAQMVADGFPVNDSRTILMTPAEAEQVPQCGQVAITVRRDMSAPVFRRLLEAFAASVKGDDGPTALLDEYGRRGSLVEVVAMSSWLSDQTLEPEAEKAVRRYLDQRYEALASEGQHVGSHRAP